MSRVGRVRSGSASGAGSAGRRDAVIVRELCGWFGRYARELPWRRLTDGMRDPYAALVSEVMLQQTQVSRVLEKFGAFVERFPTVGALADAPEGDVLGLWSGMGYYRRARNLQAAARAVVEEHGGEVPRDAKVLRGLPGVGRYTAGAIASIVFGEAEATVDGNIARVLLRVEGREVEAEAGIAWSWGRAAKLVRAAEEVGKAGVGPGVLNEALMELGAMVCTPRRPRCGACPLQSVCRAAAKGKQERIPRAKAQARRRELWCAAAVLEDGCGHLLVERRGEKGMWAGLWQAVTVESDEGPVGGKELAEVLGVGGLQRVDEFAHATTHRDVRFTAWSRRRLGAKAARAVLKQRVGASWEAREWVAQAGVSNAQRRILLGG